MSRLRGFQGSMFSNMEIHFWSEDQHILNEGWRTRSVCSCGSPAKSIHYSARLAEREGFEPPIPLRVCRISSAVLSTTQPPLRSPKRAPKKARNGRPLCNQARQDRQGSRGVYCP